LARGNQRGNRVRRAAGDARARRQSLAAKTGAAVVVVVVIVGVLVARGPSGSGDVSVEGRAARGGSSPDVQLVDFDGEPFALSDYRGTPIVLNFWASWCPNCIAEMPDFEKVHQDLKGQVAFLGIDQRDDRRAAEDLAHQTGVSYRLAEDPDGRVFDAFGGVGMPTTAFIAEDGNVVDVVTGQLNEELLRDYIDRSFGVDSRA
jgi:cytochrome c biogenesis protein CcmG, thiol:disulfide interchange protein DsbE